MSERGTEQQQQSKSQTSGRPMAIAGAALAVLLLALGTVAPLAAAPGPKFPGCKNPRAVARYLKLTPAQVAEVKDLREDFRAAVEPLRDQLDPLHEQIQGLLDAPAPDACAVGAVAVDIDEVRDDIADLVDAYEEDFEALLTPDQLTKWNALQAVCRANDEVTGG